MFNYYESFQFICVFKIAMIKIEISSEHVSGLIAFYESELDKAQAKVDEIKATIAQLKGQKTTAVASAPAVAASPAKGKRGRPARSTSAQPVAVKTPGKRGRKPKAEGEKVAKVVEGGPKGRPGRKPKPVPSWTSEVGPFLRNFMESQMETFTTNDLKRVVYNHFNANASEDRTIADKYLVDSLKGLSSEGVLKKYKDLGSKENKYVFNREG